MDRAERREKTKKKQKSRLRKYLDSRPYAEADRMSKAAIGHLKDGHFGCGCQMCKPWKHKSRFDSPSPKEIQERQKIAEAKRQVLEERYLEREIASDLYWEDKTIEEEVLAVLREVGSL